jgi:penicillin-insensitive murein endopeptidase
LYTVLFQADINQQLDSGISIERHGGRFPPHKSHQSGRDADVYYYLKERGKRWYVPATAENLDRARTWALVRAVITETDVEYLLIDRAVQVLLEEYALGIGEDPGWVRDLFHDSENRRALIRHIPGHTGHVHLRFFNPIAQQRGRQSYDRLVAQGHIKLPFQRITHTVASGDTLSELAQRYHTTVEQLSSANQLEGTKIRVGQRLVVQQRRQLRGARDPVVVPPRRLPPNGTQRDDALATRTLLLELERQLEGIR